MRSRVLSEGTYLCVLPEDLCNDNVSMRKASIDVCIAKIMQCSNANIPFCTATCHYPQNSYKHQDQGP